MNDVLGMAGSSHNHSGNLQPTAFPKGWGILSWTCKKVCCRDRRIFPALSMQESAESDDQIVSLAKMGFSILRTVKKTSKKFSSFNSVALSKNTGIQAVFMSNIEEEK
jgi:hypothetical protein